MLLCLESTEQRLACLPDCFTPPDDSQAAAAAADGRQPDLKSDRSAREGGKQTAGPSSAGSSDKADERDRSHVAGSSGTLGGVNSAANGSAPLEYESGSNSSSSSAGNKASSRGGGSAAAPQGGASEEDLLWCSPSQILSEIDARLKAMISSTSATAAPGDMGQGLGSGGPPLLAGTHGLKGEEYRRALLELRQAVASQWLASLPGDGSRSAAAS